MIASKVVTTSSGEFTIGPLTLRQVEKFYPGDASAPVTISEVVFTAMKNAGFEGEQDNLKDLCSPRSLAELRDEVFELTGLQVVAAGEGTAAETLGENSTAA